MWTDPPAFPSAALCLVNDLNLLLIADDAVLYGNQPTDGSGAVVCPCLLVTSSHLTVSNFDEWVVM